MCQKLLFLLIVLAAITSFGQEKKQAAEDEKKILLKEILSNEKKTFNSILKIEYDGDKIVSTIDHSEKYQMNYFYTDSLITKVEIKSYDQLICVDKFYYSKGRLETYVKDEAGSLFTILTKFIYNLDNSVSFQKFKVSKETAQEEKLNMHGKLIFKDANLVAEEVNEDGIDTVYRYEFDTKKNSWSNILGFDLLLNYRPSVNNITKLTIVMKSEKDSPPYSITYNYKYNSDDYPIEKNIQEPNDFFIVAYTEKFRY